ncbi:MAG: hypothetical protein NC410_08210 [Oscillibacter sp.]|nr:hypothetical protein [Oscillibacter sp.]
MKKKNNRMTPLEKLHQKQNELENKHQEEQKEFTSEWNYLREHSGRLLISGISYLFYPRRHKTTTKARGKERVWQNLQDNLPFYLAIVRESLSILWYVSRPFCFRWYRSQKKRSS